MNVKDLVEKHGKKNLLFLVKAQPIRKALFISYTSSNDKPQSVLAVIDERRYKVKDGHKVTLSPIVKGYSKEHYYLGDLGQLIAEGHIKVLLDLAKVDKEQKYNEEMERLHDRIAKGA